MFVLVQMKDTVRILPQYFQQDTTKTIVEILNKKFANKVVFNVGLCIALWDIESIDKSYLYPGDGATHTVVHFRYVVFRPFVDEILVGKVKSCSKEGINVSMGFFDDIFIPGRDLLNPSKFDEKQQLWAWEYYSEEEGVKHDLLIDIGDEVRFRVNEEKFVDTTPSGPKGMIKRDQPDADPDAKKSPYTIIGYMAEPGLGLVSWWNYS